MFSNSTRTPYKKPFSKDSGIMIGWLYLSPKYLTPIVLHWEPDHASNRKLVLYLRWEIWFMTWQLIPVITCQSSEISKEYMRLCLWLFFLTQQRFFHRQNIAGLSLLFGDVHGMCSDELQFCFHYSWPLPRTQGCIPLHIPLVMSNFYTDTFQKMLLWRTDCCQDDLPITTICTYSVLWLTLNRRVEFPT